MLSKVSGRGLWMHSAQYDMIMENCFDPNLSQDLVKKGFITNSDPILDSKFTNNKNGFNF